MAKTKITQTPQGWIDDDNPTVFHRVRRLARDARRRTSTATTPPTSGTLTRLQSRLYDRLTAQQGATTHEALSVIVTNGYNAAASYGHMREAGANHSEALAVIGLGSPDVSVVYGRTRAAGYNHTYALARALKDSDDDGD